MTVQFMLNGTPVTVDDADHHTSLLQWLRNSGFTGSKEGCAEGECGACAVAQVLPRAEGGSRLEPLNSCLLSLADAHGREIITVEGVAPKATSGGASGSASRPLHPVQQALVERGGSQCGYCTPGFVVSLFCEYYRAERTSPDPEAISGNLCRCTGYRPILDALESLPTPAADDVTERLSRDRVALAELSHATPARTFLRPTTLTGVVDALRDNPKAVLLAGGTDVMVEVNQRFRRIGSLVALDGVPELKRIEWTEDELVLGAGATLSDIELALRDAQADQPALEMFDQLLPLFSSRLIRNRATLGGNLATASPIGDSAPALLALGARLCLLSATGERFVPLHEFFAGYRKTVLQPGELIVDVRIPRPFPKLQRFYKVSKRPLDDISTVAAAFALTLDDSRAVRSMGIAYGGVAAIPLRASDAEAQALGKPWNAATQQAVTLKLTELGTPMNDHRGSADYRRAMITSLFERFCADTAAPASLRSKP